MVCRETDHATLEVLGETELEFWTEIHKLVHAKELLLCYGRELRNILFDHISVNFLIFVF